MKPSVIQLSRQSKRRSRRLIHKTKEAALKTRYLIVLHTAEGQSRRDIARMLCCAGATVDRVRNRFRADGEAGLIDRRGDSGRAKVNEEYILALITAVEGGPRDYGHRRPTWTPTRID